MDVRRKRSRKLRNNQGTTVKLGDQTIPISRLHLGLSNFRHEPVSSEAQAIAKLCDSELIAELAQDIAQRGSLSPLEVLGVVPMDGHPGHYEAVEGNRRACALIIATDPARAPEAVRAQLRRIIAKSSIPRSVKVHVFAKKEDAKQWIDLRHLGAQNGAGTREWDATQKARAAGENTKTSARDNNLSVLVLDRLVDRGLLTIEQRDRVSVSTLTRYLGTPGVRAILGLGHNRDLIYTHDAEEVDSALLKVVLDSIVPLDDGSYAVNSRTDSKDRIRYANQLKASGEAPTTPMEQPQAPPRASRTAVQPAASVEHGKRSARHPDTRNHLIPSSFHIPHQDPVLGRLRREGHELDIARCTFSANYILRALLEQVMILFAKGRGVWKQDIGDQALTQACAKELAQLGISGKALAVIQKAGGSADTPYSLHSLGHAVHGGSIPAAVDLKRHFDTWRPALEAMIAALPNPKVRRR